MFNIEAAGLVGLLTTGIVEVLKRAPQFPIVAGQTKLIRTTAAVFALLGNFGYALTSGDMDAKNLVAGTIASFLVSFAAYKGIISQPKSQ